MCVCSLYVYVCCVLCVVCRVSCVVCCVLCVICRVSCVVWCVLCVMCRVLFVVYVSVCVWFVVCRVLCDVCCVSCVVCCLLCMYRLIMQYAFIYWCVVQLELINVCPEPDRRPSHIKHDVLSTRSDVCGVDWLPGDVLATLSINCDWLSTRLDCCCAILNEAVNCCINVQFEISIIGYIDKYNYQLLMCRANPVQLSYRDQVVFWRQHNKTVYWLQHCDMSNCDLTVKQCFYVVGTTVKYQVCMCSCVYVCVCLYALYMCVHVCVRMSEFVLLILFVLLICHVMSLVILRLGCRSLNTSTPDNMLGLATGRTFPVCVFWYVHVGTMMCPNKCASMWMHTSMCVWCVRVYL